MKKLAIIERQQSQPHDKEYPAPKSWPSGYTYLGFDRESGLHRFREGDGEIQLFAKRKNPIAGWHIVRGCYCYDFVRSVREQFRGAPLGKPDSTPPALCPKLNLARVRINSQGYDASGAYWGIGTPLYWATDGAQIDIYLRGQTRADAKAEIRKTYPCARFFR